MFGKKNKGPSSEELISKLEYKMDIVEMLMERNEKEQIENFASIRAMINTQDKKSQESFQKVEEKLQSINDMIEYIRNDVDKNIKKIYDVDKNMNLEICQVSTDLIKSVKKAEGIEELVLNLERNIQEDISVVQENVETKIKMLGFV